MSLTNVTVNQKASSFDPIEIVILSFFLSMLCFVAAAFTFIVHFKYFI